MIRGKIRYSLRPYTSERRHRNVVSSGHEFTETVAKFEGTANLHPLVVRHHVRCKCDLLRNVYEDDEDNGDTFLYTGAGGRDLRELQSRVSSRH